ncbi:MAG: aspartyl-tRNA(Asn)/glutamyl-tRNA (Gln) amidotransferase subunit C [Candidatus Doudnabacteria bacterium Gr01-1014_77]|uniref:Aspartyl/glutamyl-tRNA(Asn/Gln) amidotransferase subunit C n=1 Tax=Candidatus Doudnabacteria bacterium Gr01-1014_77 TaxID=2017133 RepID=A0A554JDQ5_9BACT|nr:MAG: aspartyl-tRNA(Asn)/glutamyl-tRNA (Gln) amidotransferase subunit C [Candidatus Doudnabacteria bacterium Gr01-1014_77]
MILTSEQVRKIAALARIKLTDDEVEKFRKELSVVLDYVSELEKVNTDGVEEISQVTGLENVLREDTARLSEFRDAIIASFPESKDGFLKIKSIL